MTKRKNEICPDNVGELFYNPDNQDYYTLISCESEPSATFKLFRSDVITLTKPISEFMVFVLMKPTRPIEDVKKPRADKGLTHQRRKKKAETPVLPTSTLPGFCPEHKLALVLYPSDDGKGVWQCPDISCTFEVEE